MQKTSKCPRGEDILGFEVNEKQRVLSICLGEAKALGDYRVSAVREAHDRLANAFNPFPVSLSLIANILYERGDTDLADQIEDIIAHLASKSFPLKNWIFIICGAESKTPFHVIERTREIGVRMVLGAERSSIYGLILREGASLTAIGLTLGILCSLGVGKLIASLLFGTQAWDPSIYASVAAILTMTTLLASYIPAWRAASISPVDSLRSE